MNFPYQLGVLLFDSFLNSSHFWGKQNEFPLSAGNLSFRFFFPILPMLEERILSRLQNYKKYAKVTSSFLRKK